MTQKEKIEQEIEKTLGCIDGIQRAQANPFLFTRIKARLERNSSPWERTFSFISKPLVAVAMIVFVMAINGWSFYGETRPVRESFVETETTSLPEFENEYKLITSTDSYDYENANNE